MHEYRPFANAWDRRKFLAAVTAATALAAVPGAGFAQVFSGSKTIREVIDLVISSVPGAPLAATVDTVKAGDASQQVTGIVTTMFATIDVIRKTAASGANFIIAHEPTFYNHADDTGWLENDEVFRFKSALLQKHKIVVWRCHDYIHAHKPDGVLTGVLAALGWQKYYDDKNPYLVTIEPATLRTVTELAKKRLNIPHVKVIGNDKQLCTRIALIPGAAGGRSQITALQKQQPDLLICGELNEWETSEYIRDLRAAGSKISLLVLGHIVSEEPGLEWLVKWLRPQLPGITVTHIPSEDAFRWA